LARGLGQSMNEFRKAREDIGRELLHNEGVQPSQPGPCQSTQQIAAVPSPQHVTPAAQAIPSRNGPAGDSDLET
jgi:hypothetical protein